MPDPPEPWHCLFENITNNKRFIPLNDEVSLSPVQLQTENPDESNESGKDPRSSATSPVAPEPVTTATPPLPVPLSHDKPIPGAVSGIISVDWRAFSPVLFGTQRIVTKGRLTEPQRLHNGAVAPFVIPGRALRGMVRNVLRIATRGRVGPFENVRPARRDPRYQADRIPATSDVGTMVGRAQSDYQNTEKLDWVEAMLGMVRGDQALRGRIDFGFANCAYDAGLLRPLADDYLEVTQMAPRIGYAPFYLRQIDAEEGGAISYDSADAMSAGRARYPVWTGNQITELCGNLTIKKLEGANDATPQGTHSYLRFVKAGATFSGEIKFHNLLPEELGALLWALSLGDKGALDHTEGKSRHAHSAGRARALGFGALVPGKIYCPVLYAVDDDGRAETEVTDDDEHDVQLHACLAAFAKAMCGIEDLAALHRQPAIARLRHFSHLDRNDPRLALHLNDAGDARFAHYKRLREGVAGGGIPGNILNTLKANGAAAPFSGNILDWGSDPLGPPDDADEQTG